MDAGLKAQLFSQGGKFVSQVLRLAFSGSSVTKTETPDPEQGSPSTPVKQIQETEAVTVQSIDMPTTAETLSALKERLATELYRVELDLQNGARIVNKPCDCVTGDTIIFTGNPLQGGATIPIEEMVKRRVGFVSSHTGESRRVTNFMVRNYDDEIMRFKFAYTSDVLNISPEHPALVLKGVWKGAWRKMTPLDFRTPHWVKSGELRMGDVLAFPRQLYTRDFELATPALMELFGWYLAEGSHSVSDNNRIVFCLGKHEGRHIEQINYLMRRTFGVEPKIYERPTGIHLAFSNKEFTPLFDAFGIGAENKRLPKWALCLPVEKQAALLRGLFNGDGTVSHGKISFATISRDLSLQIRLILYRLGILHSWQRYHDVTPSVIDGRTFSSSKDIFSVRIATSCTQEFEDMVQLGKLPTPDVITEVNYRSRGYMADGFAYLPIRSVERAPFKGKLYNLSVEGDESYLTPHGAIHNCLTRSKHGGELLAAAGELLSYETNPVYGQVMDWYKEHETEFQPKAIMENGVDHYRSMVPDVRKMRKAIMGTEAAPKVEKPSDKLTLEQAKELAAAAAAKEVERQWEASQNASK